MTPDELAEIRRRDAGARTVNEIGARIPCTQDRRDLLAEVERLTAENERLRGGNKASVEKLKDKARGLLRAMNAAREERDAALSVIERVRELHEMPIVTLSYDSLAMRYEKTRRILDAADGAHQQQTGGEAT